ncbi:MAG: DsrE family protein [Acidiferrobacterales bacterium]
MPAKPLFIIVCSGEHEKLHMAAMLASVAAVSGRPAEVFISMNAIYAFDRGVGPKQRYRGGSFSKLMLEKNAPDTVELFSQGKMLGGLKMHACAMALDLLGWTMDNLVEDLFDGELGLTKFLSDAEAGDLITF